MVIARRYDPQNDVSFVTRRARNIAQRLIAAQSDVQHLARLVAEALDGGPADG